MYKKQNLYNTIRTIYIKMIKWEINKYTDITDYNSQN